MLFPCTFLGAFLLPVTWQLGRAARKAFVDTETSKSFVPHMKARTNHPDYTTLPGRQGEPVLRFPVTDDRKVPFQVKWPNYRPTEYTHPNVSGGPVWADTANLDEVDFKNKEHQSYFPYGRNAKLKFEKEGQDFVIPTYRHFNPITGKRETRPQNPMGRTGMTGRGLLGKWGANQAADPIVVRCTPAKVLEVALIVRNDHLKEWAIPGGMNDPGEPVSRTAKREFKEEAVLGNDLSAPEVEARRALVDEAFADGTKRKPIYLGYVDDPRNTDNAWMETAVFVFQNDPIFNQVELTAGDDAGKAHWVPYENVFTPGFLKPGIYASHLKFLKLGFQALGSGKACK